jgi:hypothetical protein
MPTIITPEMLAIILKKYSNTITTDLATEVGMSASSVYRIAAKHGLKKTEEFLKVFGGRLQPGTITPTAFKKGHQAWNTGTKGLTGANSGSFKKGSKPHNALNDWQEIVYTDKSGKQYIKIKLPEKTKAVFKHVYVWEQHHKNKVPKGQLIRFKDGNSFNLKPENLECITRKEHMLKNSIHNLPADLKETIYLVKTLNNKIKKHERTES